MTTIKSYCDTFKGIELENNTTDFSEMSGTT